MKNSKLIVFLKSLSATEFKDWGRYIEANSLKKSSDTLELYNYLKKQYPDFEENKIDKTLIAEKIYPNQDNSIKKIDNIMYKLWGFLEDFLIHQELQNNPKEKDFLLLNALEKRKLDKFFFKKIEELELEWQSQKSIGAEYWYQMYRLKEMRLKHANYIGRSTDAYEVKSLIYDIEQYYLAIKFRLTLSDFATHNYIEQAQEKNQDAQTLLPIQDLLVYTTEKNTHLSPHLQLFSKIYNAFLGINNDIEQLISLKLMLFNNIDHFTNTESIDIINYLSHLFFQQYKMGNLSSLNHIYELNKFMVEQKIIIHRGYISVYSFQNAVNTACALGELDWAENFIEQHQQYLEAKHEDSVALSKAALYIRKKEFDKVLEILISVKFNSIFDNSLGRALQLIAYYEMEEYEDLFLNLTKSFNLFLLRNKTLSENHKKSFNNFIHFTKKLYDNKQILNSGDIKEIESEILNCPQIVHKSWLLEKVKELKK